MREISRICVYCGSSNDVSSHYFEVARKMARLLAERGIDIVFGGGNVGLMGALADAGLAAGAKVFGVIPEKLRDFELAHQGVTELFVVDTMHQRKMKMAELSDAFVALPGGWGTLEEIFEVTTWTQLEYHRKPVGLLNAGGYYDKLVEFIDHAADEGFIRTRYRSLIQTASEPAQLVDKLLACELPRLERKVLIGKGGDF